VKWAPDGRFLYITFTGMGILTQSGRTFAVPIPSGQSLPTLPAAGVRSEAEAARLPGVRIIGDADVSPGPDPSVYAFAKITAQRNLYRVPIP